MRRLDKFALRHPVLSALVTTCLLVVGVGVVTGSQTFISALAFFPFLGANMARSALVRNQ